MNHSENKKTIQESGHEFTISEFTPHVACFWAFRILGTVGSSLMNPEHLEDNIKSFINMNRDDFETLMLDCLGVVKVKMESGNQPFFKPDGGYAIPNFPNASIFKLMVEALSFSLSPFFTKAMMGSLLKTLKGSFMPQTGLENSSTSQ